MDPKKIIILVVLLIGLVFAGKWTCQEWTKYHPDQETSDYGYGYGGGYGYGKAPVGGGEGKAPGGD